MEKKYSLLVSVLSFFILTLGCCLGVAQSAMAQSKLNIHQATFEESRQVTPEVTTEEVQRILASGSEPLLDVRSVKEYSIAHIPGSINLYEKEVERILKLYPDKTTYMVLYCNGPFCGKSKRVSEQLFKMDYINVRRYQLGLPVWRALGNTVQTDLEGFRYVFTGDKTAVFVDARSQAEFEAGSLPGAVNIRRGEAEKANEDGRLPHEDKGTRVIVFANNPQDARTVAEEIAKKAYWNSSYFEGTFEELKRAGLW
ncbi:MAG: rhodanese-like domain-containing protein [candidate division Zixibacteria bacterium]|nr:rhodanese-like domain-containing protein [candidate division Zixibacteria bacterium]